MDPTHDREIAPAEEKRSGWAVHLVCYAGLTVILIYVLVARYYRPLVLSEPIGVVSPAGEEDWSEAADTADDQSRERLDTRIDPNTADLAELMTLPRIGEVIANRIIEYREARQAEAGDEPVTVFRILSDLDAIHGIGPKTLERLEPLLLFPEPD